MTSPKALDGVNVLDLSDSIGGAYCTKLLADLGAEVVLVERPDSGHPLRQAEPCAAGTDIDSSGMFLHYGANRCAISRHVRTFTWRASSRVIWTRLVLVTLRFRA